MKLQVRKMSIHSRTLSCAESGFINVKWELKISGKQKDGNLKKEGKIQLQPIAQNTRS
jgi:hypothetical protein